MGKQATRWFRLGPLDIEILRSGVPLSAHEERHVQGGADDLDAPVDARALGFVNQGEIVFRDAVANTLAVLAPGVAGQALLTGGAGADPSWGTPAPAAHAASHKDGGTDELDVSELAGAIGGAGEIPETDGAAVTWVDPDGRYDPKAHVLDTTGPHTGTLLLTDLEVGARGEIITRTVADWAALAVGAAGESLLSGGAGADVSWGAPTPAAHVLATTGPHTGELPLTDLAAGARGEIITRTVADWAALGVGAAGEALLSGGAGADVGWGTPATQAHVLATTGPHSAPLPLTDLEVGVQGEVIIRGVADWEALATGAALQALLSGGAGADPYWGAPTPAAHAASHLDGAADEIDAADLAGTGGAAGEIIESDGAALSYVEPDGRYVPAPHTLATTGPHNAPLPLIDLEVGVQGEVIHRGAADWEALAVGAVGEVLISGGPGADVSWALGPAPGAHEATHVQGGADDIDSVLDARALGLVNQGDITFRAAAANTLATLGPGAAGTALLSGGVGADLSWGAPAPAAHAASHKDGGTDELDVSELAGALGSAGEIPESDGAAVSWVDPDGRYDPKAHILGTGGPHTGELPLTDLAAGARGEIITRTVADWAALGVGAAGQALLSGGAGADVSWGAPSPAAHESSHILGGSDDIDSGLDARALNLANQGEIVFRVAAANTLAALAVGAAGQALLTGGAGADPSWGAPAPAAHEATHVKGGSDDIDAALDARALGLVNQGDITFRAAAANTLATLGPGAAGTALLSGGVGADLSWGAPAPAAHESSHISGGSDDIDSALDGRAITLTTQGDLVYASGVNTLARLAAGTAGQTLQTGGAGANPSWTWDKQLDNDPDVTDTGSGIITIDTVGENVITGDVLYMAATGKYLKADADAVGTMPAKVMAMEFIDADAAGRLLHIGYYRENSRWNWTPGDGQANLLYVHTTAGDITQFATKPGSGKQLQIVGYVVTADIIFFNPSYNLEAVP